MTEDRTNDQMFIFLQQALDRAVENGFDRTRGGFRARNCANCEFPKINYRDSNSAFSITANNLRCGGPFLVDLVTSPSFLKAFYTGHEIYVFPRSGIKQQLWEYKAGLLSKDELPHWTIILDEILITHANK